MPVVRCVPPSVPGPAPAGPGEGDAEPQIRIRPIKSKYERRYITPLESRLKMALVRLLHDLHACARVAAPSASDSQITNWMAYDLPEKLRDQVQRNIYTLNLVANRKMTPTMLRVGILDRLEVNCMFEKTEDRGLAILKLDERDKAAFGAVGSQVLSDESYLPAGPGADHDVHFISLERASSSDHAAMMRMAEPLFKFFAECAGPRSNMFEAQKFLAALRKTVTDGVPDESIYDKSREREGMDKCLPARAHRAA